MGSDAQALLSAMSPLMITSAKQQMTMMGSTSNHGQGHSVYQHLQAVQVRFDLECDIFTNFKFELKTLTLLSGVSE